MQRLHLLLKEDKVTSITWQKSDLREKIHKEMIKRYRALTKQAREDLFRAVLMQYSGTKTLGRLKDWAEVLGLKDG